MSTRIVVATSNKGKQAEIAQLLEGMDAEVLCLADFPHAPEVDEPYETFAANSVHKAMVTARALGLPALADDSGLLVDALHGAPGVRSARVAGSDPERIAWLLAQLRHVAPPCRRARFVCALALASPDGPVGQWEGVVEGLIIDTPTGEDGFGYDPVFYYPPAAMTFAQMSREQKSLVSHRGKALREFRRAFPHLDLNSTAS